MKNPFFLILVTCLALCIGTQCVRAGVVTGADDKADSCGSGSGGGDSSHGAAPGGSDPVTQKKMPEGAVSAALSPIQCGGNCGGGSGGTPGGPLGGGGATGGGGAPCCPGDDDNNGSIWAGSTGSQGGGSSDVLVVGMPTWEVSEPYINLWLYDEPLGYQPGIGPRLSFRLAYKQRGAPLVSTNIYSVGTNWSCSWLSYVEDCGAGNQTPLILKTGGRLFYNPPNGSALEYYTHTTLARQTDGSGHVSFVRSFPSGATDYYQYVPLYARLPDGNIPVFLSVRADPSGRTNLVFAYDEPLVSGSRVLRLTSVTDADGRVTTLSYTNANPSLITGVTDPFGRTSVLRYDSLSRLTNATDVAGLSSGFKYDSRSWITNLSTPYGSTTFQLVDNAITNSGGGVTNYDILRAIRVVDAAGGTNIYMLRNYSDFVQQPPAPSIGSLLFDWPGVKYRETFHWGPRQAAGLPLDMTTYSAGDYLKARMRHWLHATTNCNDETLISQTMSLEVEPSPDGVAQGQATWYSYDGMECSYHEGTNSLPAAVARILPDGNSTTWYALYQRDALGRATNVTGTYSTGYGVWPLTRTAQYVYSGSGLARVIGPQGETLAGYAYTNHLLLRATNAVGDVTFYTWDAKERLTSVKTPAGLTRTNLYFTSGTYANFVQTAIDLEISRTNSFTYTNDLVYTHTDERGLTTTSLYDNLNRLTNFANSLGTITYVYNKLDLVRVVDRLGFSTSFAYDALRRRTAETNALGRATLYNYCTCGALDSIQDASGHYTYFTYDNAGRRTQTQYPDGYTVNFSYDLLSRLTNTTDSAGITATNWFNNQNQVYAVQDAAGLRSLLAFDVEDRVTNRWDANGVSIGMMYDNLGRLLSQWYPDSGLEDFGYSARGLVAYTNQLGYVTHYAYDVAGRKTAETNANLQVTQYSYNAADDLLTLTDGKNQTTTWHYDQYGRVTNKLDQAGSAVLVYTYDPDNRLTNRWSAAKANTGYSYDPVGNLTNIAYPSSGTVKLAYDVLNRLTNMVDGVGTTRYAYDAAGQLLTASGPFSSDTLTNTYSNRRRVALALQEPSGHVLTNGFGWDLAGRLTSATSPAGAFAYAYTALDSSFSGRLVQELAFPSGAYITNFYDPVARLVGTFLESSGNSALDAAVCGYNQGNQRTACTNTAGAYVQYTYDPIGQLTVANSVTNSEDRGYAYDASWNLNYLTNNGVAIEFDVDNRNELTSVVAQATFTYDANGNLLTGTGTRVGAGTNWNYIYDDENRLVQWFYYQNGIANRTTGDLRTDFRYDGLGRLRQRLDYLYNAPTNLLLLAGWNPQSTNEYLYDGWRVIQERDGSNVPQVSYTRGLDLSGTLEGAGGIGGLLARSSGYSSGNWTSHAYYHADGNGNITCLINASQSVVASYRYDPYGNTLSQSGTLAVANVYHFSSKEVHTNSLMYYYGYRFYEPGLQRWLNKDPVEDLGFIIWAKRIIFDGSISPNAYTFVENDSIGNIDPRGLTLYYCTVPTSSFPTFRIGRHGYLWNDATGDECGQESSCGSGPTKSDNGGPGPKDTKPDRSGRVCTPVEGTEGTDSANADLMTWCHQHANDGVWIPGAHDCHNAVDKCLEHGGLQPILFPGRFHPQPIFRPVPKLSSSPR